MTDRQWLECSDPMKMLDVLLHSGRPLAVRPGKRKLLRFAVACRYEVGRYQWPKENGWTKWDNDEMDEDYGQDPEKLARLFLHMNPVYDPLPTIAAALMRDVMGDRPTPFVREDDYLNDADLQEGLLQLARREGGYPNARSLLVRVAPYLTPEVLRLAEAAYRDRPANNKGRLDDQLLAILGDALEEAGCPSEMDCPRCDGGRRYAPFGLCTYCSQNCKVPNPLLTHLRSPGPHVRGCWALDLVLDRK